MNNIIAQYFSDYDADLRDKSARVYCPCCGEVVCRRDIEPYFEEGTDRQLEMCGNCRAGVEREEDVQFECDVLAPALFGLLWSRIPGKEREQRPRSVE